MKQTDGDDERLSIRSMGAHVSCASAVVADDLPTIMTRDVTPVIEMRELRLNGVKAKLSALVRDIENGEVILITKHGRKRAVLMSWDGWQRLSNVPTFAQLLMASPLEENDLEPRGRSAVRDVVL